MASGKEITIYDFAQYPGMTDAIISRVLNQQSAIYVDDCRMARPNSQSKNGHRVWGISEFETFGIGKCMGIWYFREKMKKVVDVGEKFTSTSIYFQTEKLFKK